MKLLPISLITVLLFFLTACGGHQSGDHAQKTPNADSAAPNAPFPVADWINSEISYVDSVPLAIIAYNTVNNHRDSNFISPAQFHRLASAGFLLPELQPESLQKNFTENSFFDKTTGYLTFTYSSRDSTLPLHRVDVLVKQGEVSNKVKSVYLETYANQGDTLVVRKMFWTSRQDFQVITNRRIKGQADRQEQLRVVWDAD